MQLFLVGHFDPHNRPQKQRVEGSVQETVQTRVGTPLDCCFVMWTIWGAISCPRNLKKKIIFAASHCICNLSVPLCIDPWNWFVKADKELVGLGLQKASESPKKRRKWICRHYHEVSQQKETSLMSSPSLHHPLPLSHSSMLGKPISAKMKEGQDISVIISSLQISRWLMISRGKGRWTFGSCHLANQPLLTDQPTGTCIA